MSIERPDLASAFTGKKSPVDRAAGLVGLLPPPRPRTSTSTAGIERSDVDTSAVGSKRESDTAETGSSAAKPERPAPTSRPAKVRVSATANTTQNIAVYLEPDLYDRVRAQRRTAQLTYDELVVDAFAAVSDHELQHALAPAPATTPASGMPMRLRRPRGTAGIQVQLRLNGHQRSWLDEKQKAVGAPSRSALVAAVLRLFLAR